MEGKFFQAEYLSLFFFFGRARLFSLRRNFKRNMNDKDGRLGIGKFGFSKMVPKIHVMWYHVLDTFSVIIIKFIRPIPTIPSNEKKVTKKVQTLIFLN